MNESEILIYHYSSKYEKWYDATKNIVWYDKDNYAWIVKFKNMEQYCHVSFSKMKVFNNPICVEFVELYYKESLCFDVEELLLFQYQMYKIFYKNGYTQVALPNEIKIIKDTLKDDKKAAGVMDYYKRVIREIAKSEEERYIQTLFDEINYVNEESILSLYLKAKLEKNEDIMRQPIICPFGLNDSQSKALNMVFTNRLSIIEGPPGTGKTQTILNIISNAVINGKSIAVVSNNNSATDNIFEKLERYGYQFICAPLGNADNVDKFFEEYDSKIPEIKKGNVDIYKLKQYYQDIPRYFKKENVKKKWITHLDALEIEYKHFLIDNKDFNFQEYQFKNLSLSPNYVQEIIVKLKEKEKIGFFERIWIRHKIGIKSTLLNQEKGILLLQNLYYMTKMNQIKKEIEEIEQYTKGESVNEKINHFRDLSNIYFKNELANLYQGKNRENYSKSNYRRNFAEFVRDYPVILSTTYSLAKCSKKGFLFDYLIIDESSQVNMASAILSMRIAKNMVVVGDTKQLSQIDDAGFTNRNDELLKEFHVSKVYSYQGNSIMSSLLSLYGNLLPRQMLKEHYRCAPEIIHFCNKEFYNNELIVYTKAKENTISMKVVKTVPGNFARKNATGTGMYNQREIDEIEDILNREELEDIGVITPYRYQAKLIQEKFGDKVEASTIHKFQGREKKTILFSSVVNDVNDFVANDNLINVAVSRAVDNFTLITSDKVANSKGGVLSDLINYISYHHDFGNINEGNIKSIYDILYSDYEEQLDKFRAKHPSKDFDTENITKELLKHILEDNKYKSFWFRMHVSLRDFVTNEKHNLTDEEFKFYMHPNAHVDFLIYNKMSKKPVFVIEVDGVSFHEQQEKQRIRDAKKDAILKKMCIPILRLKTNESNEKVRIINFIDQILTSD